MTEPLILTTKRGTLRAWKSPDGRVSIDVESTHSIDEAQLTDEQVGELGRWCQRACGEGAGLPEGARERVEHAVKALRHGGLVLRQAQGPRPTKALQLEHAADRLAAVLTQAEGPSRG